MLVGGDDELAYVIGRYAERDGLAVQVAGTVTADILADVRPAVIWFASLEALESARPRDVVGQDAPLLVCSSSGDEQRARELGADYCALHPLTYPDFVAAMTAIGVDGRAAPDGAR